MDAFTWVVSQVAKLLNAIRTSDDQHDGQEQAGPSFYSSFDEFEPPGYMLHKGRFVETYFGFAAVSGEQFILKKYVKDCMTPQNEQAVRHGLSIARRLHHKHLIKIKGTWEDHEAIYVVEEYAVKGDVLHDHIIQPTRYNEKFVALRIVKPLLEACMHMHSQGIIHRSLTPEYVMLDRDMNMLLGHFITAIDMQQQQPNTRSGFLDYMAPEMLALSSEAASITQNDGTTKVAPGGRALTGVGARSHAWLEKAATATGGVASSSAHAAQPAPSAALSAALGQQGHRNEWECQAVYDEKVDIWQVGCLVYELLLGRLPFQADDMLMSAALILWAELPEVLKSVSPECNSFIKACLTKDPKKRQSAAELLQHPWITRHEAGQDLLSKQAIDMYNARKAAAPAADPGCCRQAAAMLGLQSAGAHLGSAVEHA